MTLPAFFSRHHYTPSNGLVMYDDQPQAQNEAERYHLSEFVGRLGVEKGTAAVLFKRLYKGENPEPYHSDPAVHIFWVDELEAYEQTDEREKLHAKLWSAGQSDIYILLDKTNVKIFNARHHADLNEGTVSFEDLSLASEAIEKFDDARFSAFKFQRDTFWQDDSLGLDEKKAPFHKLLEHLEKTREAYGKKPNKDTFDRLLLLTILVMFLERKRDSQGHFALEKIYGNLNLNSFADL